MFMLHSSNASPSVGATAVGGRKWARLPPPNALRHAVRQAHMAVSKTPNLLNIMKPRTIPERRVFDLRRVLPST